jgi:glycosyltransferase involved in cell wall biosynthesis
MKILSILTYYHPHWTGLTAIAKWIDEGLAGRGHRVTVLTTRHDPSLPRESYEDRVRVVRLRPIGRLSRAMVAPTFVPVAAKLIGEQDVVQIHTPMLECAAIAGLCRLRRRPLLMTHQGDLVMPGGVRNQVVQKSGDVILDLAARMATRITTHSADYARHSPFLRPHASKVVPISPPIQLPEADLERSAKWRRELGLDGKALIGFAGRFVEEKGFDYLLRALPAIKESIPNAQLVYAGEHRVSYERFYDRCKPLIDSAGDDLTFVGLIRDRERIADFYAMCDVFVLPSRSDCFAAVQVEALLAGTPVVATDIPGAREVVSLTGMGRVVPPGDERVLATGIVQVLRDPPRITKARAEIRAVFDFERSIGEYEALLAELAGQRPWNRG